MGVTIQLRGDTAAAWAAINPVLHLHELGVEADTSKAKFGDGVTAWNSLPYWTPGIGTTEPANTVLDGPVSGPAAQPTFRALTLADLPTVGIQQVNFSFGASGAVPFTGTYTANTVAVDQNGILRVCTTAGSPGVWKRVGQLPWQFWLDDYGARGDGQLCLVNVTNGSTTITSAPVAPPAAATLTPGTSGGTMAAGVYGVILTWVNKWGETLGSTAATVTTTTGASTVTVTSAADPVTGYHATENATGWNLYMTAVGGSTYYKQNTTPLPLAVFQVITAPPTTGTAQPPSSDTSAARVFSGPVSSPAVPASGTGYTSTYNFPVYVTITGGTITAVTINGTQEGTGAGTYTVPPLGTIVLTYSSAPAWTWVSPDIGKNLMVNGSQGSPGAPGIDSIATVISPTQCTITSAAQITATVSGCAMGFASDDRLLIDQCCQAAQNYEWTFSHLSEILGSDKIYGLGANLFQSAAVAPPSALIVGTFTYNTQLRIPLGNPSGQDIKVETRLLGAGESGHSQFWISALPNLQGTVLLSFAVGPNSAGDPNYGQQSVVGMPFGGYGSDANGFSNTKVYIRGITVCLPGWNNTIAFDLGTAAGHVLRGTSIPFAPSVNTGGGVNPYSGWTGASFWQNNKIGIGLRVPNGENNDDCKTESFSVAGTSFGIVTAGDHQVFERIDTISCNIGMIVNPAVQMHALDVLQWSFEGCNGGLSNNSNNGDTTGLSCTIKMDGENAAVFYDVKDVPGALTGELQWNDVFRSPQVPTITGCQNLRIVTDAPGIRTSQGAPAYTLGTAFQPQWWTPMQVILAGGTVTGVLIGPTSAGCTIAMSAATPVTFVLPSGWWINIQGSVKPTTFTATPAN